MNTPKSQQPRSSALSSSKKTPLKGLKNVLVQPHENFWPILKGEKEKRELHTMLSELLPAKKCPAKEMSWTKLCRLSKEERAALKKNTQAKFSEGNDNNVMTGVILGINAVTKALEKNIVCSVLIDSNVEPLMIVKHIVTMGESRSIPVLMIPFLKTVTLNKIGFACAALGIKKSIAEKETEHFHGLYMSIAGLVKTFEKEKPPLQSSATEAKKLDSQENNMLESSSKVCTTGEICNMVQDSLVSKCVYEYRSSVKERMFIPPKSMPIAIGGEEMSTEYIAFGNDEDDENTIVANETTRLLKRTGRYMDIHQSDGSLVKKRKKSLNDVDGKDTSNVKPESNTIRSVMVKTVQKTPYIPLKVKRIQGNPKRMKATKISKAKKKDKMKK